MCTQALLSEVRTRGPHVPEVSWVVPGEDAAAAALLGENGGFLTAKRLSLYKQKRNDPGEPQVLWGIITIQMVSVWHISMLPWWCIRCVSCGSGSEGTWLTYLGHNVKVEHSIRTIN